MAGCCEHESISEDSIKGQIFLTNECTYSFSSRVQPHWINVMNF
jgi:hypothetical protein